MTVCLVLFPRGEKLLTEKSARQRTANLIALLVLWPTNLAARWDQMLEWSLSKSRQLTLLLHPSHWRVPGKVYRQSQLMAGEAWVVQKAKQGSKASTPSPPWGTTPQLHGALQASPEGPGAGISLWKIQAWREKTTWSDFCWQRVELGGENVLLLCFITKPLITAGASSAARVLPGGSLMCLGHLELGGLGRVSLFQPLGECPPRCACKCQSGLVTAVRAD